MAGTLSAADIDLDTLEALAIGDRAAAIARLPPDSAEQWYWRVVHAQLADPATAASLIDEAAAALPDDEPLIRRLRLRQAALTWDSDVQAGIFLDHALAATVAPVVAPENAAEAAPLIAALDAFATDRGVDTYTADGLARLVAISTGERRHAVLSRLHDPRAPGLGEALAAEAADHPEQPFGSLPVHVALTAAQLTALAMAVPAFAEQVPYVRLLLQQCADAHAQTHWQSDPLARRRYAEALLDLAKRPHLAWVAVAAHDELLLLDADPGAPRVERIVAWYTAKNLAHATVESLPLSEIRQLTGLPERDTSRLRELSIDRLLATVAQPPAWVVCLNEADVTSHHALARMLAGQIDPATAALGGPALAQAAKEKRELEWWPGQATAYPAEAPISVRLSSKNHERLAIRLWQLDEAAVLRHGGRLEIGIDLAGIAPTAQIDVPQSANAWLRQETLLPLPQINDPGTWLIEAMGNDRAVRLLLRRGAIEVVVSGDGEGNRAVVIDEQGRVQKTAQIWLDALCISAAADGIIRLPDGRGNPQRIVACAAGRACATTITLPAEHYRLSAYVLTAHEQLLAGTTARLVAGARLLRNTISLPIARLSEPTLTLRWSGRNQRSLGVQRTRLQLGDDHDAVVLVNVPEDAVSLAWELEATVAMRSQTQPQAISAHGWLELSPGLASDTLGNSLVRRASDGWHIAVRGRAGEPLVEQVVEVAVQNDLCRTFSPPLALRTDATGEISLGQVAQATQIRVKVPGADITNFRAELLPSSLPTGTLLVPGQTLALPRARHPRVFRVAGAHYLAEFPVSFKPQAGGWSLSLAQIGDYRILDGEQSAEVTVRDSIPDAGLRVGVGFAAEVPLPAAQVAVTVTPTSLDLELTGLHAGSRVHLLPLRLWPAQDDVQIPSDEDAAALIHTWLPASGASGTRTVDAEEWYSLNRRQQTHFASVMLDRPGVLLDPWHPQPTARNVLNCSSCSGVSCKSSGGGKKCAIGTGGGSKDGEFADQHLAPDWLASGLPLMDHLRPDAHGHLSIPLTQLSEAGLVVAVATDGQHLASAIVFLPHAQLSALPLRERRLQQTLPTEVSVGVTCGLSSVATGEHLDLLALPGSRVRVIDSVATFIEFVQAGWPDLDLGPFAQLGAWATLDTAAKYRLWESAASHELHLFLQRHDPLFAAEVLTPYRRQMLVPDAMLTALCDGNVQPWLRAGVMLNPLERLLLAQRLPPAQAAPFLRQVVDAAAGVTPDPSRRTAVIEACLAGALSADHAHPKSDIEQIQDVVLEGVGPVLRQAEGEPKTWIEARWWQCQQPPHIADGPLWAAYADHAPHTPFLPVIGIEHLHTATELRLLLALTDLPFVAPHTPWQTDARGQHLTAASPLLVAHRLVQPLPRAAGTVSLYRRTCRLSEWRDQPAAAVAVNDHLTPGEAYVDEVVAVNLSPLPVDVSLLMQIPRGATTLGGDAATAVQQARLAGYASTTLAVRWYLPHLGATTQAAASVTVAGTVVAVAPQREWLTTAIPLTPPWTSASAAAVVVAGLAQQRLDLVDLTPVAARCVDPAFFSQAVAALRTRGAWSADMWAWSLRHHDTRAAGEWLSDNVGFRTAAGPWLHSPLITCDALSEQDLTLVEISPLVNPRRHRVHGSDYEIQEDVRQAWSNALRYVAHKTAPDARDRLLLTCLLLAQDRVEEAMPLFAGIDSAAITARIQYDWCQAWLALARGDLAMAQRLADAYRQQPIPRWKQRWNDLRAQLAEIDGQPPAHGQGPAADLAAQAAAEPTLRLEREARGNEASGSVMLTAHAAATVVVGFRPLDLEILFDKAPFADLDGQVQRLCAVTASLTQTLTIAAINERRILALPPAWRNRTAVIEAVCGSAHAVIILQANDLDVRVAAASGSLTVIQRSTGKPVPAAYVKVMRRQGESVSFLKDGYTDRRGRFDHVAVNGERLPASDRFAILVEASELGATVIQADGMHFTGLSTDTSIDN